MSLQRHISIVLHSCACVSVCSISLKIFYSNFWYTVKSNYSLCLAHWLSKLIHPIICNFVPFNLLVTILSLHPTPNNYCLFLVSMCLTFKIILYTTFTSFLPGPPLHTHTNPTFSTTPSQVHDICRTYGSI